jgi:hypothetical protein
MCTLDAIPSIQLSTGQCTPEQQRRLQTDGWHLMACFSVKVRLRRHQSI